MNQKPTYEELERRVQALEQRETRRAEEYIRNSDLHLKTILDFVPYPIAVFSADSCVNYVNPAFTEIFGWSLDELKGSTVPYVPPGYEQETLAATRRLFVERVLLRYETRRLTKEGRILDVVMWAAVFSENEENPPGELVIYRDITRGKSIARNNEAMLRISTALPEYPDLKGLLDYVSSEVKRLLDSEGSIVILRDTEKDELFFLGVAYDDHSTQERVKEIRFPTDGLVAGKVIKTGKPLIVSDTSQDHELHRARDEKLGYHTRNLALVPLRSHDRIIGVLCAINKKEGDFDQGDIELLNTIAGTVALSIENTRFSEDLQKAYRNNEALLRISLALPEYTELEGLLDYISNEVKRLLESEGSLVILLDEEKDELFFLGAAYDDTSTERRVKETRFPAEGLVAGKVIKTGKPLIVSDTSQDHELHRARDEKFGYQTRNLALVPLRSHDRIIGVLCAINKKEGNFDQGDIELLNMIAGTVALSIENAQFSEELRAAYREVTSLNRAKDKVINHLSHELKTPVSVLSGSLSIIGRKLQRLPEENWKPTLQRIQRNLNRILDIQNTVEDIMEDRQYRTYALLTDILDQSMDELETLFAKEIGEGAVVERVRKRLEGIYRPAEATPTNIVLDKYVGERLEALRESFSHRRVGIVSQLESAPPVFIPPDPLRKVVDGLIRNAIENTPDQGQIELIVRKHGEGTEFVVRDYGVGITEDDQRRIFEGFFTTRDTMDYSSKRPFDFNAGGKGADLLRTKIFAERYNFAVAMTSSRCRFIPEDKDVCSGDVGTCVHCRSEEECYIAGKTTFTLYFPPTAQTPGSQEAGGNPA